MANGRGRSPGRAGENECRENVSRYAPTESCDSLTEELKEHLTVAVVNEDQGSFVAAGGHMMDVALKVGANALAVHGVPLGSPVVTEESSPRRNGIRPPRNERSRFGYRSRWGTEDRRCGA